MAFLPQTGKIVQLLFNARKPGLNLHVRLGSAGIQSAEPAFEPDTGRTHKAGNRNRASHTDRLALNVAGANVRAGSAGSDNQGRYDSGQCRNTSPFSSDCIIVL